MNKNNEIMYIETKGLGAGSYPEPPENDYKTYQFDFNATIKGYGVVDAKSVEHARELIENNDYDEIIETFDMEIEEITNIEEN